MVGNNTEIYTRQLSPNCSCRNVGEEHQQDRDSVAAIPPATGFPSYISPERHCGAGKQGKEVGQCHSGGNTMQKGKRKRAKNENE